MMQQLNLSLFSFFSIKLEFIRSFLFWVILVTYNIGIYICIYIYKVAIFILFLLSSTVMFLLHWMLKWMRLHCITFWDKKIFFVKLMNRLLHSRIHQVVWYLWVFIVNSFSLLWSTFFLKKTLFSLVSLSLPYRWVNQLRYFW